MVWTNSDLVSACPFIGNSGTTTKAGEFLLPLHGDQHVAEISISDLTTLATGAAVMDHFVSSRPVLASRRLRSSRPQQLPQVVSAVLNVGLQRLDGSTEIELRRCLPYCCCSCHV